MAYLSHGSPASLFMISLSGFQVVDLFFRFSSVGILIATIGLIWQGSVGKKQNTKWPLISTLICVIGYLLLTAPIEDKHYGGLRHVLLLITDVTFLAILWLTLSLLNPKFTLTMVNRWLLLAVVSYLLWLVYFFLVLGGHGMMHDFNHALCLLVFAYIIYLCLNEYIDDLDKQRRNNRMLMVAICVGYMGGLTVFEFLLRDIRNTWQFSLFNSVLTFLILACYFSNKLKKVKVISPVPAEPVNNQSSKINQLNELMSQGIFLQSNLTIGTLAEQLSIPAHQLRQMINQELGFTNFSHYLNSYRIPYICEQLRDPENRRIPILSLALEAGYGSIAPFNRAFKEKMAMTPTQYRDQF